MTDTSERGRQLSAEIILDLQDDHGWGRYLTLRTWDGQLQEIERGFVPTSRIPILLVVEQNPHDFAIYLERREFSIHLSPKRIAVFPKNLRFRYDCEVITNDCMIVREGEDGAEAPFRLMKALGTHPAFSTMRDQCDIPLPEGFKIAPRKHRTPNPRGRGRGGRGAPGQRTGRGGASSAPSDTSGSAESPDHQNDNGAVRRETLNTQTKASQNRRDAAQNAAPGPKDTTEPTGAERRRLKKIEKRQSKKQQQQQVQLISHSITPSQKDENIELPSKREGREVEKLISKSESLKPIVVSLDSSDDDMTSGIETCPSTGDIGSVSSLDIVRDEKKEQLNKEKNLAELFNAGVLKCLARESKLPEDTDPKVVRAISKGFVPDSLIEETVAFTSIKLIVEKAYVPKPATTSDGTAGFMLQDDRPNVPVSTMAKLNFPLDSYVVCAYEP